jgi:L-ascorbate metabolism protein UlaG (beta-lactamase superfamily)
MKIFKLILFVAVIFFGYNLTVTRYENIGNYGSPNFLKLIKWKLTRENPIWPELPKDKPVTKNFNIPKIVTKDQIMITYVNHSTNLIQMGGKNILTDPIWSSHAGPFGNFGVKRSIYPGVELENLPNIDFILISHSHYDHLDLPSIEELVKRNHPVIITGLGVTRYIDYCKEEPKNCYELNWWENLKIDNSEVSFNFVPAYHWSSRYFLDKNTSLWGGFVIENKQDKVYFAGDTGFSDGEIFKQIKEKYGQINLSLLPIGAYKPDWFFSSMHISPLEAVKIFKILDSKYAIPIHYDTFKLTDDKYDDPLNDLAKAMLDEKVSESKFIILSPGKTIEIPRD